MSLLLRLSAAIDAWNGRLGRALSWLTLAMAGLAALNAVLRYLGRALGTNLGSNALLEAQWYLFSAIFLGGAAWVLGADKHVRVDVVYGRLDGRSRAAIDLVGTLMLLGPFVGVGAWVSFPAVAESFRIAEQSTDPGGLARWPVKALLMVAWYLLIAQGGAQLVRSAAVLLGLREDPAEGRRSYAPAFALAALCALPLAMAWIPGVGDLSLGPALFVVSLAMIFLGYPVAFTLGGVAVLFALVGVNHWLFDWTLLLALPQRAFGIMGNQVLLAVPFFILMGTLLERSRLAEDLLTTIGQLFGPVRGGLALGVVVVGTLLAAATGVVGASVVAMGMISLPVMLRYGYSPRLATGVIAASGTLGQIIPPSVVLVVLGDQLGVSVGDLFLGAMVPGLLLAGAYALYVLGVAFVWPEEAPALPPEARATGELGARVLGSLLPPLTLILVVLGSIFWGFATPTESGAVGVIGALALAGRRLDRERLREAAASAATLSTMVMVLLLGSTAFALVFRGLYGDFWIEGLLTNLPGGKLGFVLVANLAFFVLGCFIDFFEIAFILLPMLVPAAKILGIDLVWLGVLLGMNLQTSFLTPPFGFSLFYLRGVAPPSIPTSTIYRGVLPFIVMQLLMTAALIAFPGLVSR